MAFLSDYVYYLQTVKNFQQSTLNKVMQRLRKVVKFASTVLPYNNVLMEIVSELLGHTKLATTQQSYGKIVQRKVGE